MITVGYDLPIGTCIICEQTISIKLTNYNWLIFFKREGIFNIRNSASRNTVHFKTKKDEIKVFNWGDRW